MSDVVVVTNPKPNSYNPPTFAGLPWELREKIFKMSLPAGRIVYLEWKSVVPEDGWHFSFRVWSDIDVNDDVGEVQFLNREPLPRYVYNPPRPPFGLRSPSTINLMSLNHQAREVAMKHYQKAFGTQHMPPATWFDFEVDTLYLDWGFAYKTKSRCDHYAFGPGHIGDCAEKVKKLALWDNYIINYTIEDDGSPFEEWLRGVLVEFKHLDELVLVDRYHLNTEVQRKDLVMLDEVIAIKDAMEIFKEEKGKPYSEEKTALVQKEHQFWRERSKRMTPAEKKDLEARRRSDDDWDVPKVVSWKTITTNGRLEKYKKAVEAYEMKKFADASTIEAEVEEESESEEEPETESEPDEFDDTYDSDDSDEPMTNED